MHNIPIHIPCPVRDHITHPKETSQWDVSTGIPRPPSGSLGSIINQFKSTVTKRARTIQPDFAWQPRFHDRIIRNERALIYIRRYITHNPQVLDAD